MSTLYRSFFGKGLLVLIPYSKGFRLNLVNLFRDGTMATLASNARGGYAVYRSSEWESAGYTAADNLITATIQPLLFLPAAGNRGSSSGTVYDVGWYGYYWSSSVNVTSSYNLFFSSSGFNPGSNFNRAYGFSVRCVVE